MGKGGYPVPQKSNEKETESPAAIAGASSAEAKRRKRGGKAQREKDQRKEARAQQAQKEKQFPPHRSNNWMGGRGMDYMAPQQPLLFPVQEYGFFRNSVPGVMEGHAGSKDKRGPKGKRSNPDTLNTPSANNTPPAPIGGGDRFRPLMGSFGPRPGAPVLRPPVSLGSERPGAPGPRPAFAGAPDGFDRMDTSQPQHFGRREQGPAPGPESNQQKPAGAPGDAAKKEPSLHELFGKMVWKKMEQLRDSGTVDRLQSEIMQLINKAIAQQDRVNSYEWSDNGDNRDSQNQSGQNRAENRGTPSGDQSRPSGPSPAKMLKTEANYQNEQPHPHPSYGYGAGGGGGYPGGGYSSFESRPYDPWASVPGVGGSGTF